MTHTDQSREAFEAAALSLFDGIDLARDGDGYEFALASEWWDMWQAAMAHKAADVVLPEPVAHLVECHAFRASPHGQDAEGYTWLESVEAGSPGAFAVWDEQTVRALLAAAHRGGRTAPDHPQTRMDAQSTVVGEMLPEATNPACKPASE